MAILLQSSPSKFLIEAKSFGKEEEEDEEEEGWSHLIYVPFFSEKRWENSRIRWTDLPVFSGRRRLPWFCPWQMSKSMSRAARTEKKPVNPSPDSRIFSPLLRKIWYIQLYLIMIACSLLMAILLQSSHSKFFIEAKSFGKEEGWFHLIYVHFNCFYVPGGNSIACNF